MRILLLEDHNELRQMVTAYLSHRGFAVDGIARGCDALVACSTTHYDALILDLGLPDMDGMDVLTELRRCRAEPLPALILTARDAVDARVRGLNAGADDYLIKPFDLTELEARLRAVLRRPGARAATTLTFEKLSFNIHMRAVEVSGLPVDLARREIDCLEILLRAANRVVVKDMLEERLNSHDQPVTPNALEAVISRLRKKLSQVNAGVHIETRRGIGYRLCKDADS